MSIPYLTIAAAAAAAVLAIAHLADLDVALGLLVV